MTSVSGSINDISKEPFTVTNLSSAELSYLNSVVINDEYKFESGLVKLTTESGLCTVYPVIRSPLQSKGTIGIGAVQRTNHGIKSDTSKKNRLENNVESTVLRVWPYTQVGDALKEIQLNVHYYSLSVATTTPINSIHIQESEFKTEFYRWAKGMNYYFYGGTAILFKHGGYLFNIHNFCDEGYLNNDTKIELRTDMDPSIQLHTERGMINSLIFKPGYSFESIGIGGLDKQLFELLLKGISTRAVNPVIIEKLGIKHVKGVLLYGGPGCGKTLIARQIGSLLTRIEPKIINGPEILNKYVGQSEENVRAIFSDAQTDYDKNGVNAGLHVIIFDEIDAICRARGGAGTQAGVTDGIVNQLLSKIDGVKSLPNIFIIAMTNRKDLLDPALLRPGRIEMHFEIGLPDIQGRTQILQIHTKRMRDSHLISGGDIDLSKLAEVTENYSGAELEAVVRTASSYALHRYINASAGTSSKGNEMIEETVSVTMDDFDRAVKETVPVFGRSVNVMKNLLPSIFIYPTTSHKKAYDDTLDLLLNKKRKLKCALVTGGTGAGKTTLALEVASKSNIGFIRVIRPVNVIELNEDQKVRYISSIFTEAYFSTDSLVVLDDVEVLINYVNMNHSGVSFSNKLYQVLMTVLKTYPEKKTQSVSILVTCGEQSLSDQISKYFDTFNYLEYIDRMSTTLFTQVCDQLGVPLPVTDKSRYSIKELSE